MICYFDFCNLKPIILTSYTNHIVMTATNKSIWLVISHKQSLKEDVEQYTLDFFLIFIMLFGTQKSFYNLGTHLRQGHASPAVHILILNQTSDVYTIKNIFHVMFSS